MALRYNPPPSWPAPPRGWTPTPDWTPPADFPPLPEGWELWIDDDAPALTTGPADPGDPGDPGATEAAPAPVVAQAHAEEAKRRRDKQTWTLLIIGGLIAVVVIGEGLFQILRG
ncbi:hypothetical protein [Serinibacter arcticus]|uniref:Skin secretory protein xP2 (Protein APEG) n=1 Tax=Serinibacter arcticus TaxID=1655435 RepID=A0A4Z1DZR7_9MICO|nr:hypothetical protein [Serinibacter arcticus]TGO05066.1 Skin secretory protein xP2 precursor (Protein APEG) [Serinibacter arcticus]